MMSKNMFRAATLALAIGGLASAASAAPAFLYSAPGGATFEMKFSGRTTETIPLPLPGTGLETTWGVGYVNEFQNQNNPSEKFWQSSVPGFGSATITYIIYGIADGLIVPSGPNFNIYNVGCTLGGFGVCDGKIRIDFYIDEAGAAGTNPGFTDPANGAGARVGKLLNEFTDDTFLMGWELVPGVVPSDDVSTVGFDESTTVMLQTATSTSLPASGVGIFFANCVSGSGCSTLGVSATTWTDLGSPVVADLFGRFNLVPTGDEEKANGWFGDTFDPVRGVTVPAPASLLVLGASLLGLAALGRRRPTN